MEKQQIKDLIRDAWNEGDGNVKDRFGDFLNRAARKLSDTTREKCQALLETIETMYPELRQGYWEGKRWQAFKGEVLKSE